MLIYRSAKEKATIAIREAMLTTPSGQESALPATPGSLWTPRMAYDYSPQTLPQHLLSVYNTAMSDIANQMPGGKYEPLVSQLQTPWDKSSKKEQTRFIEKARDDCMLVCKVIAPEDADKLFGAITAKSEVKYPVSGDLEMLMTAYKNANSKNVKTQILSLYAYRYATDALKKIHEPYEKLSSWQIKRARAHAKMYSPGAPLVKETRHRERLDMVKGGTLRSIYKSPILLPGCCVRQQSYKTRQW